jgi:molybdenum cofactor cytidylyltransferase
MKFGPLPVEQSEGKILAHNIAGPNGRRAFRKGKLLSAKDINELLHEGYKSIYVAEIMANDVDENEAACKVAEIAMGGGLKIKGPSAGRVNLAATYRGVLQVDAVRLARINECEGITFATLRSYSVVQAEHTVATIKIIPYGLPAPILDQVAKEVNTDSPIIEVKELIKRRVGVVFSGLPPAHDYVFKTFEPPLRQRIEGYGSNILCIDYVPLEGEKDETDLAATLMRQIKQGAEIIVLASETSTMDRNDIVPRAVEKAKGQVVSVGAPVDPGNLLLLAYINEIPILGAPGCARSPKKNIIDWVLPALLAGEHLTKTDIAALGYGGLIEDGS